MDEDIDLLIEEVEKRPALYDRTSKEYGNINVKKQLWEEVCEAVISNWNDSKNKIKAVIEVKKKWRSLRNCFVRELRTQVETKSGKGSTKRRKYMYFEKLSFLLPSVENKETKSNLDEQESGSEAETDIDTANEGTSTESRVGGYNSRRRSAPRKNTCEKSKYIETNISEGKKTVPSILERKKTIDTDEDLNFALSIVPILQSLNEYQKMEAKIQIMSLLKSIKYPRCESSSFTFNRASEMPVNPQYPPGGSCSQVLSESQCLPERSKAQYLREPFRDQFPEKSGAQFVESSEAQNQSTPPIPRQKKKKILQLLMDEISSDES